MSTCPPPTDSNPELEALRRLHRGQARLVKAVQELSLARSLPAIQAVVRRAAREIMGADGATFVLRDADRCYYADEDAISPLWKGQRFPMETCISGWAMRHGQPAVVPDVFADPRIPAELYRPTFVKSLAIVPMRADAPLGAIGAYWKDLHTCPPEELELLQALANTTAVAMENVQVYTELEQRVAARTRRLEALNQELEAFSYSVSHDLRAPLRAIDGFAEILAEEVGSAANETSTRCLTTIRREAQRMNGLIEDLLQLAKIARHELRRKPVDLARIARDVATRLREAEPERAVEFIAPAELPANGDAGLIAVVLDNLLANAWKYTRKVPVARIELGAKVDANGSAAFFVSDNGVGFDPAAAHDLFKPFHRLHSANEFPGTGVGLAIVQRIIHRHGGRIWAESKPGHGATFAFTFEEVAR